MSEVHTQYKTKRQSSYLLINEPPLTVSPTLAVKIGLNEAIVIQQLHYWLNNPKNAGRVDEDDNKWVYNTYDEWQEGNFPFWSTDKIQRIFLDLKAAELIIVKQLDAKKRDMRNFYRIDYDKLCMMDDSVLRPSIAANIDHVNMNTETTTENNTGDIFEQANKKVNAILDMANFPGAKREIRLNAILSYIGTKLAVNSSNKKWQEFAKYVDDRQQNYGESLEKFIAWMTSQKGYDIQFWPPDKMQSLWPQAFKEEKPTEYNHTETELEQTLKTGNFTPAPKRNNA
jgi:hypothetical protein